eukprot:1158838-Pelagomonas_calceolata.AAC.10
MLFFQGLRCHGASRLLALRVSFVFAGMFHPSGRCVLRPLDQRMDWKDSIGQGYKAVPAYKGSIHQKREITQLQNRSLNEKEKKGRRKEMKVFQQSELSLHHLRKGGTLAQKGLKSPPQKATE